MTASIGNLSIGAALALALYGLVAPNIRARTLTGKGDNCLRNP